MRSELRKLGIELATQDIHPPHESALVLSLDQVDFFQSYERPPGGQALCLMLSEPPTYYPTNWDIFRHGIFDRILTYDSRLVDNERYFHYHFAIDFESYPPFKIDDEEDFKQRKLCMLAAASFGVVSPKFGSASLLYERFRTLRWFAKHHPNEFDFFSRGVHPDTYISFRGASLIRRWLPKVVMSAISKSRERIFNRVYKGSIPALEKIDYVRRYKFAIAYENTEGLSGYLTEKLFDCLAGSTVPIYLGDLLPSSLVPSTCYIDRRQFATHEDLYNYITQMTYARYAEYGAAIQKFMKEAPYGILSTSYNTRLITNALLGLLPATGLVASSSSTSSPTHG